MENSVFVQRHVEIELDHNDNHNQVERSLNRRFAAASETATTETHRASLTVVNADELSGLLQALNRTICRQASGNIQQLSSYGASHTLAPLQTHQYFRQRISNKATAGIWQMSEAQQHQRQPRCQFQCQCHTHVVHLTILLNMLLTYILTNIMVVISTFRSDSGSHTVHQPLQMSKWKCATHLLYVSSTNYRFLCVCQVDHLCICCMLQSYRNTCTAKIHTNFHIHHPHSIERKMVVKMKTTISAHQNCFWLHLHPLY